MAYTTVINPLSSDFQTQNLRSASPGDNTQSYQAPHPSAFNAALEDLIQDFTQKSPSNRFIDSIKPLRFIGPTLAATSTAAGVIFLGHDFLNASPTSTLQPIATDQIRLDYNRQSQSSDKLQLPTPLDPEVFQPEKSISRSSKQGQSTPEYNVVVPKNRGFNQAESIPIIPISRIPRSTKVISDSIPSASSSMQISQPRPQTKLPAQPSSKLNQTQPIAKKKVGAKNELSASNSSSSALPVQEPAEFVEQFLQPPAPLLMQPSEQKSVESTKTPPTTSESSVLPNASPSPRKLFQQIKEAPKPEKKATAKSQTPAPKPIPLKSADPNQQKFSQPSTQKNLSPERIKIPPRKLEPSIITNQRKNSDLSRPSNKSTNLAKAKIPTVKNNNIDSPSVAVPERVTMTARQKIVISEEQSESTVQQENLPQMLPAEQTNVRQSPIPQINVPKQTAIVAPKDQISHERSTQDIIEAASQVQASTPIAAKSLVQASVAPPEILPASVSPIISEAQAVEANTNPVATAAGIVVPTE
ncbi:hypothetical protein IQ266_17180 [filamentous cyanobacterium LEGE 11480]|uniref:Uncharacterized protein n=1 Tax=Romeriopsis navalis LEGE 11480 TaxID=2777977 RepID=A0A928VSL8_9CYAN|nr:hypothetical protein [Romeriopsis navalis]MBE9031469.1 hypothetical protein [Romeriopsis navalis LEGE 11480]